jgi:hypothetical protein
MPGIVLKLMHRLRDGVACHFEDYSTLMSRLCVVVHLDAYMLDLIDA